MTRAGSTRVLYVQYCNPAAYPPLEHSAQLLAEAGFDLTLLGTDVPSDALRFQPHPRIRVNVMSAHGTGVRQKLHYLVFAAWVLWWSLRWRPSWIYASDPLSCPVALAVGFLLPTRTIYHEHDVPAEADSQMRVSIAMRIALWARRKLARRADLCVVPNRERAEVFRRMTGREDLLSVWNCPTRAEATRPPREAEAGELRVVYHGSIVPDRLPLALVRALASLPLGITLTVVGYETLGHFGYSKELEAEAARLHVDERLRFVGAIPTRSALIQHCGMFDVGLALFSQPHSDVNQRTMIGASNKAFDFMACGLALLVTDLPEWREAFVEPGFGSSCQPDSVESLAAALQWFWDHPAERQAMGLRGRQKILDDWNYERTFAPVLEQMVKEQTAA